MHSLPLQQSIVPRAYQEHAADEIFRKGSSLLVMPTGLGKTLVAFMVIAHFLKAKPSARFLFLAPTKPLVEQQAKSARETLDVPSEKIIVITGETEPSKRKEAYSSAQIVFATPQCIENDVLTSGISLKDFSLIIYDEAHRAMGDYSYVFIGQAAIRDGVTALGLTASPSSREEKVREICNNLGVKHIEVRTPEDEDVRPFVNDIRVDHVFVTMPPELAELRDGVSELLREAVRSLKEAGALETAALERVNKRELIALRMKLVAKLPDTYKELSTLARAINIMHAKDLLETQGVEEFLSYFKEMSERKTKSKAVLNLIGDFRVKKMMVKAEILLQNKFEHPKMKKLHDIVQEYIAKKKSMIIFAHFRATADKIEKAMNAMDGVRVGKLTGKSKEGMSQKKQVQLVEDFREGKFNVLVATQVGEEGLDIPAVDLIIFYEAVPSEIRLIQRRGRTGRVRDGQMIVLVMKGTKDEAFLWISRRKEKALKGVVESMKGSFAQQATLGKYESSTKGNTNDNASGFNRNANNNFESSDEEGFDDDSEGFDDE